MSAQSPEVMDESPIGEIGFNRAGRPMSLTDFPSQPSSPRFLGSRHSMYSTGRRPLRSSPLAGPALRVDEAIEEVDEKRNQRSGLPRPSRVLSTPNLATLLTLPPPLRHTRPKTAESDHEGFSHVSISSPPTKPSKCSASPLSQRRNSEIATQLQPPSSPSLLQSRSASSLSLSSYPAKPGNVRSNNNEKGPWIARPAVARRPQTAPGYSTLLYRPITTIPEKQLDQECIIPPAGSHGPKDNSWFTTNTYDVTPKFSRLGLAASGVVLPVSAKEHKRLSRPSSRSSMSSGTPSTPGVLRPIDNASGLSVSPPAPPSTPAVTLNDKPQDGMGVITPTLTRSSVSSRGSEASSITPLVTAIVMSSVAVAAAATTDPVTTIATIMDGKEPDGSLPRSKDRDEQASRSQKTTAGTSKKNKLLRFKFLQYRTSPKSSNATHHTSITQKLKLNRPQSNEKRKGSNDRRTGGGGDEIKLRPVNSSWFTSSESSLSDSSDETDTKRGRLSPVKESSRIKRLWKSIAMNW